MQQALFGIVISVIAFSALIVWLDRNPVTAGEPITQRDLAASPAAALARFHEEGSILIEEREGSIGVAWLVYSTENRPIVTKKLVFENLRTCAVEAGDLPCATDITSGRLPVSDGQRVRVEGTVSGEQVHVERLTYL